MRDERYIRIDGKPLLVVYRPNLLPSASKTAARWRQWCKKNGIGEIYLAYTQSFETVDPSTYGFDAAIEFPPNNSAPPIITDSVTPLSDDFDCTVYDWRIFVERSKNYQKPPYTLFRGVCPSWDNTARRKNTSGNFINNTPELYQNWLENAIKDSLENQTNPDERLIFVNAWNEWAEGAYLEPDTRYGYAWLQATRNALEAKIAEGRRKVLLVTHDCHPHGAQFLALEIARELVRNGFLPAIIALDGGRLFDEFAQIGPMIVTSSSSHGALCNFLTDCRNRGYSNAITSTVVCGSIVPELKRHGFQVLSLIHELSGVIHEMKQESNAKHIAELSDRIVFPAKLVRDHYTTITPFNAEKAFIRPQGLLRKNPYQGKNREAHREVCQRHGFPINTRIILSIGFLDHRKGADLFVKIAAQVCHKFKDIVFIWVGHTEPNIERDVRNKIKDFNLQDRILLIGFDPEPFVYYAAASVYALTSREDPFPNVVLESASVGVPIVAFENTTGAAEFIVQQGGLLARHLDVAHFATHIETLLADQTKLPAHLSSDFSLRRYVLDLLHYLTASARISVIVPNYNYARLIKRRLDSIRMQTYPIYELIILDDASTDESVSRITDYCRKNDCDARVVLNKANSGSVFSQWQKGIRMATGDLVWIAEADDSSDPNFLSTLVPAFDENEIVLACCQSRQINEKGRLLATDYLSYTSDISRRWQNDHFSNGVDIIRESLSIKNVIPNVSGVLFDRQALVQALENIGEDLFDYRVAGDWLVYLHVLVQGRFFFSSKSLNDHCRHTQSVTCDAAVEKHLDEVAKLQTIAQKIAQPDEFVIAQAHEYLEQLRVQFGLDKIQDQKES
jgi:glycosyltransferase involved in cell wall biosynthesis